MVVENCKAAPTNKIDDIILLDSLLPLLPIKPFSPSLLSSRAYRISFFLQGSDDVLATVDKAAEENASLDGSEDSCSSTIAATEEIIANVMTTTCTLECYVSRLIAEQMHVASDRCKALHASSFFDGVVACVTCEMKIEMLTCVPK